MSILPDGEGIRRAIRWVGQMREEHPDRSMQKLIGEAELKFDLTPKESMYLYHVLAEKKTS